MRTLPIGTFPMTDSLAVRPHFMMCVRVLIHWFPELPLAWIAYLTTSQHVAMMHQLTCLRLIETE
jgi:hypothetical protein